MGKRIFEKKIEFMMSFGASFHIATTRWFIFVWFSPAVETSGSFEKFE